MSFAPKFLAAIKPQKNHTLFSSLLKQHRIGLLVGEEVTPCPVIRVRTVMNVVG